MTARIIGVALVALGAIGVFFAKQLIALHTKREATDKEIATFKLCALLVAISGTCTVFLT